MAYRFVLEVPRGPHEGAKRVIASVDDAEILSEEQHSSDSTHAYAEIAINAHSLDIIDQIFTWIETRQGGTNDIYIIPQHGDRLRVTAYNVGTMRRVIQSDHDRFEDFGERTGHIDDAMTEGGARVSDVPFGGKLANSTAVVPAEKQIRLGRVDHIALKVRDLAKAEQFYHRFFGMDVMYRACQQDGHWRFLDASFDWHDSVASGIQPEMVRLENGPVAIVLTNVGYARTLHEARVAYVSVQAPMTTLNELRGKALFSSYAVYEDTPQSFRFSDPFGMIWQIIAETEK